MSQRLESLAEHLAAVLSRPAGAPAPFAREVVIVPNQGMARWLKLELAARHGICANYFFPFPDLFTNAVLAANSSDPDHNPVPERETMLWSVWRLLPELVVRPEFAPLNHYLAGSAGRADARKRFQLAAQIAGLFDQYQVFRPDLVLAWDRNETVFSGGVESRHEAWQSALWRRLRSEHPAPHLAELWREFSARLAQTDFKPDGVPPRISVFGLSALPPMQLQLLYALGGSVGVHLFLLQPSSEYWGSITSAREAEQLLKAAKKGDAASDELHLETGNRLLASMGQLGRDFLNLLLETGDWSEHSLFPEPTGTSLLEHIQADIFHLRNRGRDGEAKLALAPDDDSLRVHSCHSPLREVEVLHDQMLDWFERDPALSPREVLVMTPDIEAYAPFVQSVFDSPEDENRRIPFSLADRGTRSLSPIVEAFLNLLDLPSSRLEAAAVLRPLETAAIRNRFGLSEPDLEFVRSWVQRTNIRWGRDAVFREALGLPGFAQNTWQQGMEQLLLGYAMNGCGERLFHGILPFADIEGGAAEVLGHFARYLQQVFDTVAALEKSRPAGEWEAVLLGILDAFFDPDESQLPETLLLREVLHEISRQAEPAKAGTPNGGVQGEEEPVELSVMLEALDQSLARERFGAGFITGGVTFCALKPMRSIPFKIICLLGMNDGAFPRADRHLSFDLMARKPRLGDRSLRADDRYLFLETLLAARQRLHISYVGQSIRDNSEAPPSVLVSELLDYVTQGYEHAGAETGAPIQGKNLPKQSSRFEPLGRSAAVSQTSRSTSPPAAADFQHSRAPAPVHGEASAASRIADHIVVKHRLQAFSPKYFNGADARLFSYSAENLVASHCGQGPRVAAGSFFDRPLAAPDLEFRTVDAAALAEFFCHSSKWLLTRRLGLRLEEADAALEEAEPFEVGSLDAYAMRQQLVELSLKNGGMTDAFPLMNATGRLPLGETGAAQFRLIQSEARTFFEQVRARLWGGYVKPVPVDVVCGEFRVRGEIRQLTAAGLLHYRCASIKAKDLLRLWIQHVVINAAFGGQRFGNAVLVGRDEAFEFGPVRKAPEILAELLELYWQGLSAPLKFFPQTSLALVEAKRKGGRGKPKDPMAEARKAWEGNDYLGMAGEGQDAYHDLCFRNADPLDKEFRVAALKVFKPLLRARREVAA